MKRKPTVYVLCGFIGAGKTTFAKKLEESTGAIRITKDEWLIRLIGNDSTIDGYAGYDHGMCEVSREVALRLAELGIDVILDEGFWAKDQREAIRRRIEDAGAQAVLYFADTPIDTIRKRVALRNTNPASDSFTIGLELFDCYLKYWQPPKDDEQYVRVGQEDEAITPVSCEHL